MHKQLSYFHHKLPVKTNNFLEGSVELQVTLYRTYLHFKIQQLTMLKITSSSYLTHLFDGSSRLKTPVSFSNISLAVKSN